MLSKRERQQLKKLLSQAFDPADSFNLNELDGFLYGLAITPEMIRPEEWLPVAFGEHPPDFRSEKEADRFYSTMMKAYNSFQTLRLKKELRFPFNLEELTEEMLGELTDWVFGFHEALTLRPHLWASDAESGPERPGGEESLDMAESISVVWGLACPEEAPNIFEAMDRIEGGMKNTQLLGNLIVLLPHAVATIQAHAEELEVLRLEEEALVSAGAQRAEKIGRNEPCPCGSGKKYKKCCQGKDAPAPEKAGAAAADLLELAVPEKPLSAAAPQMNNKDRALLQTIVKKTVAGLEKGNVPRLGGREEDLVFGHPAAPFELVDMLSGLEPGEVPDETSLHAVVLLLSPLLEELRASIERSRKGATDRLALLQKVIAEKLLRSEANLVVANEIVRTLQDSRLDLLPVLKEAHHKLILEIGETDPLQGGQPDHGVFIDLLDEIECADPFEGFAFLMDQLRLVDPQVQLSMIDAFADSQYPLLRDIAALAILHPEPEVRNHVPSLLSRAGKEVSPETLRRFIVARNWLPEAIRPDLDACIQKARKARVECASLKGRKIEKIHATPLDGAGAQGLWVTTRAETGIHVECVLWKQSEGIIDAWGRDMTKTEGTRLMRQAGKEAGMVKVERWYLDKAVCHALSVGLDAGKAPPVGLLQVAEWLEISDWKPAPLDREAEINALYVEAEESSKPIFSQRARLKVLQESFAWGMEKKFAQTWFEDDATVFKTLKRSLGNPDQWHKKYPRSIDVVLDKILEPKRAVWLERLVFTTLWLKANTGRPPLGWHKMLLLANQLDQDVPLRDCPLMAAIAEASLLAAQERGE